MHDDVYEHALDRLLDGEVDLVVTPIEGEHEAFDFELLLLDRFLLVVGTTHRLARKPVVTIEACRAKP
jgi:DNA-binding transcriptional LysR family regulator